MLFFVDEIGGEFVFVVMCVCVGFVVILIGFEGGFDVDECDVICGYLSVVGIVFGFCILCVEMVVVVVVVLWMVVVGDWVG